MSNLLVASELLNLEDQLQTEIDPPTASLAIAIGVFSGVCEASPCIVHIEIPYTKVCVIEHVEHVEPELQGEWLAVFIETTHKLGVLEDREVAQA